MNLLSDKDFRSLNKKKEVEICSQIQSNTVKNNRLNEIKMTSCPVVAPLIPIAIGKSCNLICERLV